MDIFYDGGYSHDEHDLGRPIEKPSHQISRNNYNNNNAVRKHEHSNGELPGNKPSNRPSDRDIEQNGMYEDEDMNNCWTWVKYPPLKPEFAAFCFVINMILPGIGTLIATFSLFCCAETSHWTTGQKVCATLFGLMVAFLQIVLAIVIVGWIWSCIWGSKIFMKSMDRRDGPMNTTSSNQVGPRTSEEEEAFVRRGKSPKNPQLVPVVRQPSRNTSVQRTVQTEKFDSNDSTPKLNVIPSKREPSREQSRHPVPTQLPPRRTTTHRISALDLVDSEPQRKGSAVQETKFSVDAPPPASTPEEKERKLYSRESLKTRAPSPTFPEWGHARRY